jgi:hypothetical protein
MLLLNINEALYSELCLPETMKIAEQAKRLLWPLLRQFPKYWSFPDKVLVMLAPTFIQDVANYYYNNFHSPTFARSRALAP